MNLKDEPYLVEQIKDQVCYVVDSAEVEMKKAFPKAKSQVSLEFVLPDGVHNERGFVQNPRDPACVAFACNRACLCGRTSVAAITKHISVASISTACILY